MDILHTIFLALLQGITEFLPVSSSAHLILPKDILGWPDQGLAFDVAVHVGTLSAVMLYFRKDIIALTRDWALSLPFVNNVASQSVSIDPNNARLAWGVILATVPAALLGLLGGDFIEAHLRSSLVIACTTIVFGLALLWADKTSQCAKNLTHLTLKAALIIGIAQALALIPGTSRSGITITAALFLGFTREDSARFSFLLSIPIILLSGGYMSLKLIGSAGIDWVAMGVGMVVSGISAYLCIHYFLVAISKMGMLPFVIYRLLLGGALLLMVFV